MIAFHLKHSYAEQNCLFASTFYELAHLCYSIWFVAFSYSQNIAWRFAFALLEIFVNNVYISLLLALCV